MRKVVYVSALAALVAVCLAAPAGAQGFSAPWGCMVNGWPCWMAYPAAADNAKVLTYSSTLRQAIWSAASGGISGMTATRVPFALNATTAAQIEALQGVVE